MGGGGFQANPLNSLWIHHWSGLGSNCLTIYEIRLQQVQYYRRKIRRTRQPFSAIAKDYQKICFPSYLNNLTMLQMFSHLVKLSKLIGVNVNVVNVIKIQTEFMNMRLFLILHISFLINEQPFKKWRVCSSIYSY